MDRIRLTPQRINKLTCPKGKKQAFLWDSESPRLAVRVTTGSKSYIYESKLNRRTIRKTIGATSVWTIEDARKEANRLQELVDRNIDPRELERQEKEEQEAKRLESERRKNYTLSSLGTAYVDYLYAQGKNRSAAATRSAFKCHVNEPYPELANTAACEITPHQIAEIIRRVKDAGKERMAGILRSYLLAAYNTARKAPFDASIPADFIPFNIAGNPVEPVAVIRVIPGNRTLADKELKAYIEALGNDLTDKALKLALYSGGQRMAQLLRAKVEDYDSKTKTLRLFDSKGKRTTPREHLLPLASKAANIVSELVDRAKRKKSPSLFVSRNGSTMYLDTPGKRVSKISANMKGEPFNLRDIRRTCETQLAKIGISRDTRAQLLSHGFSGVQATFYDRHDYAQEKRKALVRWENHLERIETEKPEEKIVDLKALRKA